MDELENEKLIDFWNNAAKEYKGEKIDKKDFASDDELTKELVFLGNHCESILDYGCGFGTLLMTSNVLGTKVKKCLGIDPSENMIEYAKTTSSLSSLENIEFKVGELDLLKSYPYESFDGVICSNVLDVITEKKADEIIQGITRVIKKNGYLLVKVNFYIDQNMKKGHSSMEEKEENYFMVDGILRDHNLPTEVWKKKFIDFSFIEEKGFKRAETLPPDRILLFIKK